MFQVPLLSLNPMIVAVKVCTVKVLPSQPSIATVGCVPRSGASGAVGLAAMQLGALMGHKAPLGAAMVT